MAHVLFGLLHQKHVEYRGDGFFAGQAADPSDPDSPDGRFRILNVPSRGRVTVYERSSMRCVAETLSATDGTWRIENLSRSIDFTVIGWDGRGLQNAAIQDWVRPALME